jgi:hypothetical protein
VSEEMQQRAVDTSSAALERYNVEKDIAMFVKREFDRLYGTTWRTPPGLLGGEHQQSSEISLFAAEQTGADACSFGSFVTHGQSSTRRGEPRY